MKVMYFLCLYVTTMGVFAGLLSWQFPHTLFSFFAFTLLALSFHYLLVSQLERAFKEANSDQKVGIAMKATFCWLTIATAIIQLCVWKLLEIGDRKLF